ncbi:MULTISPECIES: hypothetical protein [unclassified Bradyrhizobium]|uniref:hypothetical protein n=1 Tax=unclassified Bradyrhizobium TaxID=2631580 RepID=UPI001BAC8C64|nr:MULTISPECIES: hypothetical protein [unclassified Bradyrhizobium]MBR1206622.1 hypothetical protein [Bradyrhizobium sp. AUGA SZCCT0124]MBR1315400.1 hypothetical protein [Bradyrhizobium sp. AUGA SZCCT0051]MBR1338538.1 hypothetical protein [Bradyrhizobium sp. AUGA SZCCT0105]MBR1356193.1 hypothetical protein [Bradyrhizobium sp. AUGA SZCCT0045]
MNLVDQIVGVESGGDANAKNANSSAAGPGQFIDSTWLDMLAKHRPDITGTRDELLALKTDPALSREMTAAYAADNGGILKGAGLPVTPGTQYLAHFAGPQGAVGILSADPSTPAGAVLGAKVVKANPFVANMSAGDLAAWADRKMGGKGAPMSIAGPAAVPSSAPAAVPAGASASADAAPAQPSSPSVQITGPGGGAPAVSLAQLTAVPQGTNFLPALPNVYGLKIAPFSFRGRG